MVIIGGSEQKAHHFAFDLPRSDGCYIWPHRSGSVKLFGEPLMARDFDRHVAELQIRAPILNRFTAPGTRRTQRVG